jgi:uncharacterized membrane protein
MRVNMILTSVITTRTGVIYTRRVQFPTCIVILTLTCDFNKHKSDYYTQSVILTHMSVIMTLTSVITTRTNVITTRRSLSSTRKRLISSRRVRFPHA